MKPWLTRHSWVLRLFVLRSCTCLFPSMATVAVSPAMSNVICRFSICGLESKDDTDISLSGATLHFDVAGIVSPLLFSNRKGIVASAILCATCPFATANFVLPGSSTNFLAPRRQISFSPFSLAPRRRISFSHAEPFWTRTLCICRLWSSPQELW